MGARGIRPPDAEKLSKLGAILSLIHVKTTTKDIFKAKKYHRGTATSEVRYDGPRSGQFLSDQISFHAPPFTYALKTMILLHVAY